MIAIDGPASSGKSVLGEALARALGYTYFDTGALYRTVTWLALCRGIDVADETAVAALARDARVDIQRPTVDDGRQYTVLADGEDVTWCIVRPEVDAKVSVVSAHPKVREALLECQRKIAASGGVVMVGRDMGTVVVPDADVKVYLKAALEVRGRRRYQQMVERGQCVEYQRVLETLRLRDSIDSGRAAAPLKPAPDAFILDNSEMTIDQELELVLALVKEKVERAQGK